ncbi:MAG: amino acid racemase [Deltaproteobacteria bacterium]|nr:amino acid racemase [Deltaproteobacteria bacterium]
MPMHFTDRPHDLTVGVLGGMGPLATADFFTALVRRTPADKDWNHLHIIIDNNPRIPSRTRAILFDEAPPTPYLIDGARRLEAAGAQLIVVPCNSASYFLDDVRAAVATPILDPVMATSRAVRERGVVRPLVLGGMVTHRANLYGRALAGDGIDVVRPTDAEQDQVAAAIEALKSKDASQALVERVGELVRAGAARGADGVILGCTEFGLIADRLDTMLPVFNSNDLLAARTLELARTDTSSC